MHPTPTRIKHHDIGMKMYLLKMIGIERIFQEYTHGSKKRHQDARGSNRQVVHSFNSKLERPAPLKHHHSKMKPRKRNITTHPLPKKKNTPPKHTSFRTTHKANSKSEFSPLAFLCWLWAFGPPPFSCRQPPASSISPQFPQVFLPGRRLPAGPEET